MKNHIVCNGKQVDYTDIGRALEKHNKTEDVSEFFKDVRRITRSPIVRRVAAAVTAKRSTLDPKL